MRHRADQVILANSEIANHSEQFDFLVWALEQSRERFLPKVSMVSLFVKHTALITNTRQLERRVCLAHFLRHMHFVLSIRALYMRGRMAVRGGSCGLSLLHLH